MIGYVMNLVRGDSESDEFIPLMNSDIIRALDEYD